MDKQTRVEKYKKYRESIKDMQTYNNFNSPYQINEDNLEKGDVAMSDEELQEGHIKKNTLSISMDQIVKAHDEYTTMISQEEIDKATKKEKKLQLHKLIFRILVIVGIVIIIALIAVLFVFMLKK